MTTSADEPSIAPALPALSEQAGDVHVRVTPDLICLWTSDGSVRPGVTVADAFAAEDAAAVARCCRGTRPAPRGPASAPRTTDRGG